MNFTAIILILWSVGAHPADGATLSSSLVCVHVMNIYSSFNYGFVSSSHHTGNKQKKTDDLTKKKKYVKKKLFLKRANLFYITIWFNV